MLSWFVAREDLQAATKRVRKITEDQVQSNPDLVPSACIDETVDMRAVRKFFTDSAWQVVEAVLTTKSLDNVYTCGSCLNALGAQSVSCDGCLLWFDFKCVALKAAPKASRWFCLECRSISNSQ